MRHQARLEVVLRHPADVPGAQEGGADRLCLLPRDGRSPEPAVVSQVCRESDLPVRVLLRLSEGFATTAAELARLAGLASSYLSVGAEGVVFGFLDQDLGIETDACTYLADRLGGAPWTFDQAAFDTALDTGRAWREVLRLPGLDTVASAGSARGTGHDELVERALASPAVAYLLTAAGALPAEQVPWLVRAGVRRFQLGDAVRPGGSRKAYVDARLVRSWRMLLDDTVLHAEAPAG